MTVAYMPPRASEPTFRCVLCQDDLSGYRHFRCEGGRDGYCGRPNEKHKPHHFVARCPCWLRRNADALRLARKRAEEKRLRIPFDCELLDQLECGSYRYAH